MKALELVTGKLHTVALSVQLKPQRKHEEQTLYLHRSCTLKLWRTVSLLELHAAAFGFAEVRNNTMKTEKHSYLKLHLNKVFTGSLIKQHNIFPEARDIMKHVKSSHFDIHLRYLHASRSVLHVSNVKEIGLGEPVTSVVLFIDIICMNWLP